ncbi:MAG: Cna B domain-containing protein [candidate division WS6 bacterium GW2011_GWF2_39_15]|uniref:Cna B domain-containing protein n=1 Tax=candidate division WS6 bacterium GW2011_GWF2_39_15 TaxID=1619100 RepID=A0A0G0MNU6_9BACT|nr:MAG: Cna B domain-containing protein [candidate division WS6 bacterium GW2011_GWF2_39_15]
MLHLLTRFASRYFSRFISVFLSLYLILGPALSVATSDVFAASVHTVVVGGNIQAAINAADPGDIIDIQAGTFTPSSTLNVNKSLTIQGAGIDATVIDAAGYTGYGMHVTAGNVILKNFTFRNAHGTSGYGLKIANVDFISLENLKVELSYRTNVDFYGVDYGTLLNVQAYGATYGNGISITNGNHFTLTNITTSGNAWGGIALYTGTSYLPAAVSDITINGAVNISEPVKMYSEVINLGESISDIHYSISDFKYVVTFAGNPKFVFYFGNQTLDSAIGTATLIGTVKGWGSDFKIFDNALGYYVYPVPVAPVTLGLNVQSKSATPGSLPVALACGNGTNDNTPSHVWSAAVGSNIKYQRAAQPPAGSWWTDPTIYSATNTDWLWFGTAGAGNGWDGTWKLRVRAFEDANSNNVLDSADSVSNWSNECAINYDDTKPTTPVIEVPDEGKAFNTTPILNNWSDSVDTSGILKYVVEYQYDDGHSFSGGPYRETTVSQRNHVPNLSEEGGVKFRVKAVDNFGNESGWSEWRHYNYDITNASSVFNTPLAGNFNSEISITGTSVDNVGVDFVTLFYKNSSDADVPANWVKITDVVNPSKNTPFNWSYGWTPIVDGTYDLKVSATDKAGNVENTAYVYGITFDATAPAVPTLVSPADGAYIKPSLAMLDWSDVTDPHGPVTYKYKSSWNGGGHYGPVSTGTNSIINATASAYRTYSWQVQACDSFGNCSDWSGPWTVTIDGTAPTMPKWTNTERFTQNGDYAYTTDRVRMDMKFTQSSDTFGVDHYDYQFVRADLDGNKLQSGQVNMNTYLGGISCVSGICTWKPDLQDNSQWIFRMRAVDKAGNTSSWSNWNGASDSQFYNFSFDFNDFDAGAGVFARGDYDHTSGNASFVVRENVNPISEITSPDIETNNTIISINYTASDVGTKVKTVGLYRSDDILYMYSDNGTFYYNLVGEPDGTKCFYTRAEDTADDASLDAGEGNIEAVPTDKCEIQVKLDTTAPTVGNINFTVDFNPYLMGEGFGVSANVSDSFAGIKPSTCEFTYDGGLNWESGNYVGGKCVDFKSTGDNQSLAVNVRVQDRYGNIGYGSPVVRTSDLNDPTSTVTIDNVYSGPMVYDGGTINGVATDSASEVELLKVTVKRSGDNRYWNGSTFGCMLCFLPQFKSVSLANLPTWTYSGIPAGSFTNGRTYTVTPYATDSVWHIAQGTSDAFIWDSTAPTDPSSYTTVPAVGFINDNTITVNWPEVNLPGGAFDTLSGVAGYSYDFTHSEVDVPDNIQDIPVSINSITSSVLDDGVWYFHLRTVDNVGNWTNTSHVGPFTVDVTDPSVTISSPVNNSWVNHFTVSGTADDATSRINNIRVEFRKFAGGALIQTCEATYIGTSWSLDVNGLSTCTIPDGKYRIIAIATDNATNSSSVSKSGIKVDTTGPMVGSIDFTVDFDPFVNGNGFLVSVPVSETFNDANARRGLDTTSCKFSYDNGSNWENGHYGIVSLFPLKYGCYDTKSAGENQTLEVLAKAKDLMGNEAISSMSTRISDRRDPSVTVDIDEEYYSPSTFGTGVIKGTSFDAVSGIDSIKVTIQRDSDGKFWNGSSWCNPLACILTKFRPTSLSSDSTSWSYDGTSISFTDGVSYTVKAYAYDKVLNSSSSSDTFVWDITAPTADIVFPAGLIYPDPSESAKTFEVVFSEDVEENQAENPANYFLHNWPGFGGSGDLDGDATIVYDPLTYTATVTLTNAGWYVSPEQEWGVENIHDLAGNLQLINPYSETSTELIAPVTTVEGVSDQWYKSDVTVSLACTDIAGSGCARTYYTTDGTEPTTGSAQGSSFVLDADGEYVIKYFSVDNAGNIENIQTLSFTVKVDKTNPINPSEFVSDPDINTPSLGSDITVTWNNIPEPASTPTPSLVITGAVDNLSGVNGFSYLFTQNATDFPDTVIDGDRDTHEVTQSALSDGSWYFHLRTVDLAGNWSDPVSYGPMILDNQKPVISLIGAVTVTLTAGDTYTDQGAAAVDNQDGDITPSIATISDVNDNSSGTYHVTYNVTDTAGNPADEVIRTVVVVNPPVVPAVQGEQTGPEDNGGSEEPSNIPSEDNEEDGNGEVLGLTCEEKQTTSGYVYEDKNGNGRRDSNEKGIGGVKIEIRYTNDNGEITKVMTVTTDKTGKWKAQLCPADYTLALKETSLPENYKMGEEVKGISVKSGEDLNNINIAVEKESSGWDLRWAFVILAILLVLGGGANLYLRNRMKMSK